MAKLTHKQAAFAREYTIDCNCTQAAIRAGYSRKTANQQGHRLFVKPCVQAAIQKIKDAADARAIMGYEEMCASLTTLARGGADKHNDQIKAMEQLAKIRGYVAPVRSEISGPGGTPISIQPITEEQAIERYAAALQRAGVRALTAGADDTSNG